MYLGFFVRVLLVSLLTFGQHANALSYRSGGSSSIKPLFDYSRNHKLDLASDFDSSAQPGGFLGSSGSSRSEGGQVDRYSPMGSVSSYGSGTLLNRKPTQNSRQPPQTNPNANGVVQPKADMWDLVLPQNGKRFELGIASSKGIIMQAGPQPEPQQHGLQTQQPDLQPSYQPKPQRQQPGHQPSYQTKPQQPGYQTKPQQPGYQTKPQQPGYQTKPQQPGYQTKPQQPGYQPQRGGIQSKPAMWEFFSPVRGVPANLKAHRTVPTRTVSMPYLHRPRWQQSLVHV